MNFQQLEYVLAVHKHRHFGRAAESCHVTQATLSAMIKRLENELELVLFDRSRQPVQTTETGERFVKIAQKILLQKNEMFSLGKEKVTELTGQLTIGVIPTIANALLPIILPPLLENNPNLQLHIKEITTEEIKRELMMDKLDFGILATPLEEEMLEENILYYEPMMVYGIRNSDKEYLSSEDVKNNTIWLLEEGHCFRQQAITLCNIQEKDPQHDALHFEGNSFETLLALSDTFGGLTLVPELYYQNMPKEKQAFTKHFKAPIPVREVSLVSYRPYAKQQTIEYFCELIPPLLQEKLTTTAYSNKDLEIIGIN